MKILAAVTILFSLSVYAADEIVQLNSDGVSNAKESAKARSEALADALSKGCLQVITNLIGEAKVSKNSGLIKSKILSQTSKFVQYYKAQEPTKKGDDTITSVTMKISVTSLRDLLSQNGLLFQTEGSGAILPIIKIVEKRDGGRAFRWWVEEANSKNAFLFEQTKAVIGVLESIFRPRNFYVMDPVNQHYVQWLPDPYRVELLSGEDMFWVGGFFKAQMVMAGDLTFEASSQSNQMKATIKLTTYNVSNRRIVGEVTRAFETFASDWDFGVQQTIKKSFPEVAKDLATQVFEEWSRGTFGATLLKLTLKGPLGYKDVEVFKTQVSQKIPDIKKMTERRLENGQAMFEMDVAGGMVNLVKKLEGVGFEGFKVAIDNLESEQVHLRWAKVQ